MSAIRVSDHIQNKHTLYDRKDCMKKFCGSLRKHAKKKKKNECLGENIEKQKTFSVPLEKEVTEIDNDDNDSAITIPYKTKFRDSARFITTSLLNIVDYLAKRIHKTKC